MQGSSRRRRSPLPVPGRLLRHAVLNDLVFRSLVRAGYPSTGLLRTDGRRSDGQMEGDQTPLAWRKKPRATVTDSGTDRFLPADTSLTAGAVAERASTRKTEKYNELSSPIQLWKPKAPSTAKSCPFSLSLGKSYTASEMRETAFLFQRISIEIQRFIALAPV